MFGPDIGSRLLVLTLFVFLLGYLAFGCTRGLAEYDEGLICYGGERVLQGGVPYRDFWSGYGPGQYYLLAAAYKIFGISLLTGRIYTVSCEWLVTILAYFLGRKLRGTAAGVFACITIAIWLSADRSVLYPVVPALMFVFAGFLMISGFRSSRTKDFLAGLLVGCATLVRHDIGVYAFPSLCVTAAGQAAFVGFQHQERIRSVIAKVFKRIPALFVGLCFAIVPAIWTLLHYVPESRLYEVFVDLPFRIYPKYRSLPFPPPGFLYFLGAATVEDMPSRLLSMAVSAMMYALPLFVPILAAILIVIRCSKGLQQNFEDHLATGLTVFGIGLWVSIRVRPDAPHMLTPGVVSLLLVPWLLSLLSEHGRAFKIRKGIAALLAVSVGLLMSGCLGLKIKSFDVTGFQPLQLDRAKGISIESGTRLHDLVAAVNYVDEKVPAGQAIYVGNIRHDKILFSSPMFYFLAARPSATRFPSFDPGIQTTFAVQTEMTREIQNHHVNCIVLWTAAPQSFEPNLSSQSSGVRVLDDFIRNNYSPVLTLDDYSILWRSSAVSGSNDPN